MMDVVPGLAHAPATDSVGHAGYNPHFNNLLVLYLAGIGGSQLEIQTQHTEVAGVPLQKKSDPLFQSKMRQVTSDPGNGFQIAVPEPSALLLLGLGLAGIRIATRQRSRD